MSDPAVGWGAPGADYGFGDEDAATRSLLRSRPPARALAWVAGALGGTGVSAVRALRGGMSSAIHAMTVDGDGAPARQDVRRRGVEAALAELG